MSSSRGVGLGDLARVTTVNGQPLDYKLLFEQEHVRRCDLEGRLAETKRKYAGAAENNLNVQKQSERIANFANRVNEVRRSIAARMMAALIIADEFGPDIVDWYDYADKAVSAADALILTLQETKDIGKRPRDGK